MRKQISVLCISVVIIISGIIGAVYAQPPENSYGAMLIRVNELSEEPPTENPLPQIPIDGMTSIEPPESLPENDVSNISPPSEVPEPSTLVLFGLGILGMIGLIRQRRKY